jgi:hypothetical protein
MDEVCGVRAAHHIDFMQPNLLLLADALEYPLGSRSFYVDGNAGISGFEYLRERLRHRKLHGSVERDCSLLPGGVDQGGTDRGALRHRSRERLRKYRAGGRCRGEFEHVAPGEVPIKHGFSLLLRSRVIR